MCRARISQGIKLHTHTDTAHIDMSTRWTRETRFTDEICAKLVLEVILEIYHSECVCVSECSNAGAFVIPFESYERPALG